MTAGTVKLDSLLYVHTSRNGGEFPWLLSGRIRWRCSSRVSGLRCLPPSCERERKGKKWKLVCDKRGESVKEISGGTSKHMWTAARLLVLPLIFPRFIFLIISGDLEGRESRSLGGTTAATHPGTYLCGGLVLETNPTRQERGGTRPPGSVVSPRISSASGPRVLFAFAE